jgi:hypothetical protein
MRLLLPSVKRSILTSMRLIGAAADRAG